jgi:hypothetical protein
MLDIFDIFDIFFSCYEKKGNSFSCEKEIIFSEEVYFHFFLREIQEFPNLEHRIPKYQIFDFKE